MKELIVATGNAGKLAEIREILGDLPVLLMSLADRWNPVPAIPETGSTFEENALLKASWVFDRTGTWALADDSGLEVDALDGAPGVTSARYAGESSTSAENNAKLLAALAGIPQDRRTARFRCVIVLKTGANSHITAKGTCEGSIITGPRGNTGFGYDPLFIPESHDRTFAEFSAAEKHAISHRGKALAALRGRLYGIIK